MSGLTPVEALAGLDNREKRPRVRARIASTTKFLFFRHIIYIRIIPTIRGKSQ
jgi:hypothetical protein